MWCRKGQSTLEYILVLTAIIATVILFSGKFLKDRVKGSLEDVSQKMEDQTKKISFP
jgi:Flp pilus assembly pilin Flp